MNFDAIMDETQSGVTFDGSVHRWCYSLTNPISDKVDDLKETIEKMEEHVLDDQEASELERQALQQSLDTVTAERDGVNSRVGLLIVLVTGMSIVVAAVIGRWLWLKSMKTNENAENWNYWQY